MNFEKLGVIQVIRRSQCQLSDDYHKLNRMIELVVYIFPDVLINPSFSWWLLIFLIINTFGSLPLISDSVDDIIKIYMRRSVFQMVCPRTESITPPCEVTKPSLIVVYAVEGTEHNS